MESGLCLADYAVIAVFFAAMIGVGLWSQRRARDAAAYFGKDKSASWWLSGISFYMNSFSAHGAFAMTTPGDTSMATKEGGHRKDGRRRQRPRRPVTNGREPEMDLVETLGRAGIPAVAILGKVCQNATISMLDSSVANVSQRVSASQAACLVGLAKRGFAITSAVNRDMA